VRPPVDTGANIAVAIATSGQGASDAAFRVRLELPGRGLVAHGVELELLPLFSAEGARRFRGAGALGKARELAGARRRLRRELRGAGEGAPIAFVQRYVDLTPSLALERAAAANRRLVYDVDDAVWLSGGQTGGHRLAALKGAARKVRWLAERADHTIAGNEVLAEHLSRYSDAVTIVPSLVDPGVHALRAHEQGEMLTLGWIGSPTTAPYLLGIVSVLEKLAKGSPRPLRLVVVGGSAPRIAGVEVEERPWSPEAERVALAEMDIGLMPLDDTPWARGKCAYKALQYMASGIPPVADDVGVVTDTVGDAGYAVAGAGQWLEALGALADDPGLRTRMGEAGRRRVEEEFSPARWLPTIATILRGR
jgi:glycosyltransferase involved in cell wall biosynthesis